MSNTAFTIPSASVVVATNALTALNTILKKAQESPDAASLPSARLHENMKPLTFQIHSACHSARALVNCIIGTDNANTWGTEDLVTFNDMHTRIDQAQELLASAKEVAVNEHDTDGTMTLKTNRYGTVTLPIPSYIALHNQPYMFFFVITAYGILRKEGVDLTLGDYLEPFNITLQEGSDSSKALPH